MKKIIISSFIAFTVLAIYACGGGEHKPVEGTSPDAASTEAPSQVDDKKGLGKFKDVVIPATLDNSMAASGESIAKMKCLSCHKLTDEKLVGPGWKDVTTRRTAAWTMNFVTNTEEMLNKDAEAIASLEICLVRMPNQNLNDDEARQVYEYMRKNDGVK